MPDDHTPRRRLLPAIALFFLSPLIAEFLLGNQPITELPALALLAPMYGGGALLIREVTRRTGRGWPTMVLLAAAYGVVEEGLIDQMLWNPHYGGFDMRHAYAQTYVPALGTSVAMVQDVLSMHTIWSICVPIAIVETFGRDHTRPWLGPVGVTLTGALFVAASVFLAAAQAGSEHFMASPAQFAGSAAVIVALIAAGLLLGRRPARTADTDAPRPWPVAAASFAVSGLYWNREMLLPVSDRIVAVAWCVLAAALTVVCVRWSRRSGWGPAHRLALAGGALLTYVWVGFTHARDMGVPTTTGLLGNAIFGTAAVLLLAAAARAAAPR